jgi:hypothetical protein
MGVGSESEASSQGKRMRAEPSRGIHVNVTRTRVTLLVFNLTIISLMLSMLRAGAPGAGGVVAAHLTSFVALFTGFCLTLLGLWWLLSSQDLDSEGLSRPWSFALGSITTYLALSHTVTAFMHTYLVGIESAIEVSQPLVTDGTQALFRLGALGNTAVFFLFGMGGTIWILLTYVAPLIAGLKSPVHVRWRWGFAVYYLALQSPIYWVYSRAFHLQYVPVEQPTSLLSLFALQFAQPLLWLR